ncbi:MFS transporter [Superficieibacter electus]|uniref:MFS transporter n=1 Tax=Superficieibacter electus TaxID=2022662 RepID=A0A2P5GQT6_9ENTR|nr:MFS transporter [Superficieibacter electus]POP43380.1 MFS transporter [Superficieibacter electus]POP48896.1 MFS transporter [Superficieibacter electus]
MQLENSKTIGAQSETSIKRTNVRWLVVAMLFFMTLINYADRSSISLAGPQMAKDLGLSPVDMGIIFSAFGWAYVMFQLPGGWLLDKFGSRLIYSLSIFFWSLFTLMTGLAGFVSGATAVAFIFAMRFMVGTSEAPSFPANSRIVASWFPASERGTAAAIFNSAQYGSTVFFAPLMGWLAHTWGWHSVFTVLGLLGIAFLPLFRKIVKSPKEHPQVNEAEIDYISAGGALISLDESNATQKKPEGPKLRYLKQLLSSRMMLGTYLAQYCLNAIGFFFITWFPIYLVQEKNMSIMKAGMVAAIPAICGFLGGLLGGFFSDFLIKKGVSVSVARKIPIISGMMLCCVMVLCNYTDSETAVIAIMAMSFLGKGIGGMGWTINTDTAPREIAGLSGSMLNTFSNASSITTPIITGYILDITGSFHAVLWFVISHAVMVIFFYLFVVGKIQRLVLK